jgi:hypothetical protein
VGVKGRSSEEDWHDGRGDRDAKRVRRWKSQGAVLEYGNVLDGGIGVEVEAVRAGDE